MYFIINCVFRYITIKTVFKNLFRKLSDIESKFHNLLYLFSENLIKQDAKQFQKNNFDQPFKISFKEAWAMTSWNNFYKMWRHKMMVAYSMKISWADFLKGLLFMLVVSSYIYTGYWFFPLNNLQGAVEANRLRDSLWSVRKPLLFDT